MKKSTADFWARGRQYAGPGFMRKKPRGQFHRLPFGLHCASGRANRSHGTV